MGKKEKPIRIAHIIGNWFGGGVESVVMNYYKNIDREKIQFDFFCSKKSTHIPYDDIINMGGRVFLIPSYSKVFEYQKTLIEIFKENNYTVVHSHISTMSLFPLRAAKKAKVPVRIVHSHSTTNKKEKIKYLMKQILRKFSRAYSTDYMCCSELAGRWLFGNKLYDKNKVYLVNNAIDLSKFRYDKKVREDIRRKFNISNNTLVIGHIGRFVETKNHDGLIDIFNEVNKIEKDSILVLAGQGPLMDNIRRKVKYLKLDKNIIFLGQVNNVNELYQAFDVFLLPSLSEGLPVVGVEAQSSGLLCIFSNDMTKETKILESTIFMSLKTSPKIWAKVLLKLLNNHKRIDTTKEMTNGGFNIIQESKKMEEVYIELLKEKRK
jgi:glycosyltransferase involved in cell wall biosynthesis